MRKFRRRHHQLIAKLLQSLDTSFLSDCACYFGGGTQLTLIFGEYRESRDIDFLCSSRTGFRKLRETVNDASLGAILKKPIALAREVRADRDGIRTFFLVEDVRIKFEILLEARIDLSGAMDRRLGVPALTFDSAVAEKFLANADRGLDAATHARDIIDLAAIAAQKDAASLRAGLLLAQTAYGETVVRELARVLAHLKTDKRRLPAQADALGIEDLATIRKGLHLLERLAGV